MIDVGDEIHLFIFCARKYKKIFLEPCILSIERNIKDKIVSRNIVSDDKFERKGFNVIHDDEIWQAIDPKYSRRTLYENFWLKQQILKLSCDTIQSGNILIVDADLFFLKPMKLIENNKFNFYMAKEFYKNYFYTNKFLLDLDKYARDSFISDFILFNTDVLKEMKSYIEKKFDDNWINVVNKRMIRKDRTGLSEYEMYGNFLLKHHRKLVNKLIEPIDYKLWLRLYGEDMPENLAEVETNPEKFLEYVHSKSNNYYQSVSLIHSRRDRSIRHQDENCVI